MKKTSTLSLMSLGIWCVFSLSVNAQLINEGFEGTFPPAGWTVDNPDGLKTFEQATVGKSGSKSAFIDVFNMDANGAEKGQMDALITSAINLSSVSSPTFTFYYAYQMYTDPASYTTADALSVYTSTDGGISWNSVFNKSGNTLVTATPQFNGSVGFVPSSSDWIMETVNISSVATSASVQFKIELLNDWENNIYIDDILVNGGALGANEVGPDPFANIFPNPSSGNFNLDISGQADIIISNMLGDEIHHISHNPSSPERIKFNLEDHPNGVYFVKVKTKNGSTTKKLLLSK